MFQYDTPSQLYYCRECGNGFCMGCREEGGATVGSFGKSDPKQNEKALAVAIEYIERWALVNSLAAEAKGGN